MRKSKTITFYQEILSTSLKKSWLFSKLHLLRLHSILGARLEKNSLIYFPPRDEVFSDLSHLFVPVPIAQNSCPQPIKGHPRVEVINNLLIIY